jgi:hypothetical protein
VHSIVSVPEKTSEENPSSRQIRNTSRGRGKLRRRAEHYRAITTYDGNPRMRGRLDVVERERQGQEASLLVCRRVALRICSPTIKTFETVTRQSRDLRR